MFFPSSLLVALFALLSLAVSLPLAAFHDDGCSDSDTIPTPSPTPTPTPTTSPTLSSTSSSSTPAPSPATNLSGASSGTHTGGIATYFYQDGNAGACGQVNPDSAMICAMDQALFGTSGNSPLCGQQVVITNQNNGNTLTVTVADDCPTCENSNSIDLSVGAFSALSDNNLNEGTFPISWYFAT